MECLDIIQETVD